MLDMFKYPIRLHFNFWLVVSLSEAYDALDPNGNITIKWDIISWTPDGYVVCTLFHFISINRAVKAFARQHNIKVFWHFFPSKLP